MQASQKHKTIRDVYHSKALAALRSFQYLDQDLHTVWCNYNASSTAFDAVDEISLQYSVMYPKIRVVIWEVAICGNEPCRSA